MQFLFTRRTWLTASVLVIVLVAAVGFWGCSSTDNNPTAANDTQQDVSMFTAKNPAVQSVMAVQNRHTKSLMADPEVIGTATTLDNGEPAIMVLATSRRAMNAIPKTLDGVRVVAANHGASGHGGDHRCSEQLDEPQQCVVCPGAVDARAREHERTLRSRSFRFRNSRSTASRNWPRSVPPMALRTETSTSKPVLTSTPSSTATYISASPSFS